MLGAPVCEKDFYDRKELLKKLKTRIHHAHHALIGSRGCGKSSILLQLATLERPKGLLPVYVDLSSVTPRTQKNALRKIGKAVLTEVVRERGRLQSMPAFISNKVASLVDFVRDTLRVKIGEWITLYFDPEADLTDFMEKTFSTIESYGVKLLVMLDEVTSLVRFQGPKPKEEDMDFMEALRSHLSQASNAHYILTGSQVGLMNLITKGKFGRLLVPEFIGELEEEGAKLLMQRRGLPVSQEIFREMKEKTKLWPLYVQAYCIAANLKGRKIRELGSLDEMVFDLLYGHFKYLESQLGEQELVVLLTLEDGRVKTVAKRRGASYYTVLSAFRTLELKGFLEKISPGTYGVLDPMFTKWLRGQHEVEI